MTTLRHARPNLQKSPVKPRVTLAALAHPTPLASAAIFLVLRQTIEGHR
jgi:hypothetical protein